MKLTSPSTLKNVIETFGFSFSKGLGQNFLIDENVLNSIISASGIDSESCALEIGPGAGTLTRALAENSKKVVAVEIDKKLLPVLNYTLDDCKNAKVINNDILEVDLDALIKEEFKDMPVSVVANLPYYITTPIIMKFLEEGIPIKSFTVMVQKEVADRMAAAPGTKDYGALSAAVQFYTKPSIVCKAEPHCFMPQPKVASVVIHLDVLGKPSVEVCDKDVFFKIIKSAFGQRRKTLVNALSHSPYIKLEKDKLTEALGKIGLDANIRGEKLSLKQFADLTNALLSE